jgi:hypothetical protein
MKLTEIAKPFLTESFTKGEMLNQMFSGTQFERNYNYYLTQPKPKIQKIYTYFVNHPDDSKRVSYCAALLSY